MSIHIDCEYCDSVYDYNENHSCPNCGAVPDKKQIAAAKAAAKAEAQADSAPAPVPVGKLMKLLIKLIPVWLIFIFIIVWIPGIKGRIAEITVKNHLQTIDTPRFIEHELDEEFLYDGLMDITVDDAYFAESPTAEALLPNDIKLLVVHITASAADGANQRDIGNYYNNDPYIESGKSLRRPLSYSALRIFPDIFAQQMFHFSSMRYYDRYEGYFCFLVDKDEEEFTFCLEETHTESHIRQLDCVHRVNFSITEEAEQ